MSAPLSGFPYYFILQDKMLAFTGRDKMYKIEMIGSNKNPGCTIDHYITRNMVLKHWPGDREKPVPGYLFKNKVNNLFAALIDRIVED